MAKTSISRSELTKLKSSVDRSTPGESFLALRSTDSYRIGAGYRVGKIDSGTFYIEIMLTPSHRKGKPNLEDLEFKLRLLRSLERRENCDIQYEDDGSITCEFLVSEADFKKELLDLERLLAHATR